MTGCPHCKDLAVEVASIKTTVDRIDHELLGNGQPGKLADHGKRLGKLETWRGWVTGALAVLGLVVATATAIGAAMLAHR